MHKNLVKFSCVVFELCKRRDKQTDNTQYITIHRALPWDEVVTMQSYIADFDPAVQDIEFLLVFRPII